MLSLARGERDEKPANWTHLQMHLGAGGRPKKPTQRPERPGPSRPPSLPLPRPRPRPPLDSPGQSIHWAATSRHRGLGCLTGLSFPKGLPSTNQLPASVCSGPPSVSCPISLRTYLLGDLWTQVLGGGGTHSSNTVPACCPVYCNSSTSYLIVYYY